MHQGETNGNRVEDKNPDDCKCGRSWYPRFPNPTERKRFKKICPGCHNDVYACTCTC